MKDCPETILLACLLQDRTRFCSGSLLAEMLGVSRVSVWGYFEKLRAEGFRFEAVRNRGYRLLSEPNTIHGPLLNAYLRTLGCPCAVYCEQETASTNTDAAKRLIAGGASPFFVTAVRQSAGRGRLGRAWFGEESGNLYLTMGVRPQVPARRLSGYTLWLGLQLCRHLAACCAVPLHIKWPNDLVCGKKKIAGMLTEMYSDADAVHSLVFGIGLNINGTFEGADDAVRAVAGSLRSVSGRAIPMNATAADVMHCLYRANEDFFADALWREKLLKDWPLFDALAGAQVCVRSLDGHERSAMVLGLSEDGGLRVRSEKGEEILQAGDVSLSGRPLPA